MKGEIKLINSNEEYKKTLESVKKILQDNLSIIYHLSSKKYPYIVKAIEFVKKDLYDILNYFKKINPIIYKQKYVWYIDTFHLTYRIRKKTTRCTSNKHFNYLCSTGLLRKVKQTKDDMLKINQQFLESTGQTHPMNVFTVYRYTEKQLQIINERCRLLLTCNVTVGNISADRLRVVGLTNIATEVYFSNQKKSHLKKEEQLNMLFFNIDKSIGQYGYTRKDYIYEIMPRARVDNLFKIFKEKILEKYSYKPPFQEEKEKFHLANGKWIIRIRERNLCNEKTKEEELY